ncbi:MAG: hypothetical protein FD180_3480 [Planctomycetota bacterium]|nr:MAG: hypothetical protein FD180_3480 [Planctomycetota bacterium]
MFAKLAEHQVVVNGVDQFSPAVSMSGNNTAKAGITVLSNTATSLTVNIQGSNDLQGWTDSTSDTGFTVGFAATANRALAFAYARLKYVVVGTGTIIVAADLFTSQQ